MSIPSANHPTDNIPPPSLSPPVLPSCSSSDPVQFADQLYVLANITHVRDYSPTVPDTNSPEQQKHLRLLDDIALLLITQSTSDVAAVTFEQTSNAIVFYFSKNRPSTASELKCYDSLLKFALQPGELATRAMGLLERVVPPCRNKISARIKRLQRVIPTGSLANLIPPCSDLIDLGFRDYLSQSVSGMFNASCASGFLRDYLALVRDTNPLRCPVDELVQLVQFASIVGSFHGIKDFLRDEDITRRLRKVGNYYGATRRITRSLDAFQKRMGSTIEISLQEVTPQPPSTTLYPKDYIVILNRFAAERGLQPLTMETLRGAYPGATMPSVSQKDTLAVTHSVHAECTLAMYMILMRPDWNYIELGVSKGSCWMCEKLLQHLHQSRGTNFLVSNFHGKLQSGWVCPPLVVGVLDIAGQSSRIVAAALEEIIEHSHNRRRSDSFPRLEADSTGAPDPAKIKNIGLFKAYFTRDG